MGSPGNENMHRLSSDIPPTQVPTLAALGPRFWNFPGLSPEKPTRSQNSQADPNEGHDLPRTTKGVSNEMSDLSKLTQRSKHNEINNLLRQNVTSHLNNRLDASSEYTFTRPQSRHYRSQSVQPQTQRAEGIQISERYFDHRKLTVTNGSGMMPESISFAQNSGDLPDWHKPDELLLKFCNSRQELEPKLHTTAERVVSNISRHKPNLPKNIHMHTNGKSARLNRASTAEPVSSNRNLQTLEWLEKLPQAGVPEKIFFEDSQRVQPEPDEVFSNRLEVNSTKSEFHSAQSSFSQPRRGATASPRDDWTLMHLNQSPEVTTVPRQTIPSKRSSSDYKILSDQAKRHKGENEKHESDSRTFIAGSDGYISTETQHINTRHRPVQMGPDVQRQGEITPMDWSAPKWLNITSYMKNGKVQREVPDVISLLSSDDSVAEVPPTKLSITTESVSIPVTAVSTSKSLLPIRSSRISESNGNLLAKATEGRSKNEVEEEQRQKRAAVITLTKEDNALSIEIFGEGSLNEEEKRNNLETQRTASLEAQRAKENKCEQRKEAKLKAETQKKLEVEEKFKHLTLMKEQEEARKKEIRDTRRLEDALVQEKRLDERRGATAERIQERRLKDQEIQTKRTLEGGFRSTQAEKDELQALKINQEIAQKQAASLHSAKLDSNAVQDDEDSLFLPEHTPKRNQGKLLLNEVMSAVKSKGPKNASEVFAQYSSNSGISGYRTERDAVERIASVGKALYSRKRPGIQQKVVDRSPTGKDITRPGRPIDTQESNNPNTTGNRLGSKTSKSSGFIIDDDFEDVTDASSTPSCHNSGFKPMLATDMHVQTLTSSSIPEPASKGIQTQLISNHVAGSLNSTNISSESIQSGLVTVLSQKSSYSVKLLSDVRRKENQRIPASSRKSKSDKRTEQQKLARKKKDDERARQKEREKRIKAATQAGVEISETALEIQLDAHMQKRENGLQRRKEIRERKEANQTEPDPAAAEALLEEAFVATRSPTPEVDTNKDDHVNNSMEAQQQNAETKARKESEVETLKHLDALRKTRGVQFLEAARKTHVADIDGDGDVSEEDPDEPIVATDRDLSPPGRIENYEHDAERDSDHEQDINVFTNSCASSSSANTSFGSTLNSKSSIGVFIREQVHVYTVLQVQVIDGEDQESEVVEHFLSLEEANSCAQTYTEKVRQRYQQLLPSMTTSFKDRMYNSQIWYDETKQNGLFFRVARQRRAVKDIASFDPVNIPKRLPEKSWLLKQTTTRIDEAVDGHPAKEIHETIFVPKLHFSNLIDANYAACESAMKFLKPKRANIDQIVQYSNKLSKQLRETRDQDVENNKSFRAEIEVSDENACWMKPLRKIIFQVEEFEMMGPKN